MRIIEKLTWLVLPTLVIGIGVLEFNFPHAMNGFDDPYTGRGVAGFIVLLFEVFLWLIWSKIGGAITILLGILLGIFGIIICFSPMNEQSKRKPTESPIFQDKTGSPDTKLTSLARRAGKAYVQRKLKN